MAAAAVVAVNNKPTLYSLKRSPGAIASGFPREPENARVLAEALTRIARHLERSEMPRSPVADIAGLWSHRATGNIGPFTEIETRKPLKLRRPRTLATAASAAASPQGIPQCSLR